MFGRQRSPAASLVTLPADVDLVASLPDRAGKDADRNMSSSLKKRLLLGLGKLKMLKGLKAYAQGGMAFVGLLARRFKLVRLSFHAGAPKNADKMIVDTGCGASLLSNVPERQLTQPSLVADGASPSAPGQDSTVVHGDIESLLKHCQHQSDTLTGSLGEVPVVTLEGLRDTLDSSPYAVVVLQVGEDPDPHGEDTPPEALAAGTTITHCSRELPKIVQERITAQGLTSTPRGKVTYLHANTEDTSTAQAASGVNGAGVSPQRSAGLPRMLLCRAGVKPTAAFVERLSRRESSSAALAAARLVGRASGTAGSVGGWASGSSRAHPKPAMLRPTKSAAPTDSDIFGAGGVADMAPSLASSYSVPAGWGKPMAGGDDRDDNVAGSVDSVDPVQQEALLMTRGSQRAGSSSRAGAPALVAALGARHDEEMGGNGEAELDGGVRTSVFPMLLTADPPGTMIHAPVTSPAMNGQPSEQASTMSPTPKPAMTGAPASTGAVAASTGAAEAAAQLGALSALDVRSGYSSGYSNRGGSCDGVDTGLTGYLAMEPCILPITPFASGLLPPAVGAIAQAARQSATGGSNSSPLTILHDTDGFLQRQRMSPLPTSGAVLSAPAATMTTIAVPSTSSVPPTTTAAITFTAAATEVEQSVVAVMELAEEEAGMQGDHGEEKEAGGQHQQAMEDVPGLEPVFISAATAATLLGADSETPVPMMTASLQQQQQQQQSLKLRSVLYDMLGGNPSLQLILEDLIRCARSGRSAVHEQLVVWPRGCCRDGSNTADACDASFDSSAAAGASYTEHDPKQHRHLHDPLVDFLLLRVTTCFVDGLGGGGDRQQLQQPQLPAGAPPPAAALESSMGCLRRAVLQRQQQQWQACPPRMPALFMWFIRPLSSGGPPAASVLPGQIAAAAHALPLSNLEGATPTPTTAGLQLPLGCNSSLPATKQQQERPPPQQHQNPSGRLKSASLRYLRRHASTRLLSSSNASDPTAPSPAAAGRHSSAAAGDTGMSQPTKGSAAITFTASAASVACSPPANTNEPVQFWPLSPKSPPLTRGSAPPWLPRLMRPEADGSGAEPVASAVLPSSPPAESGDQPPLPSVFQPSQPAPRLADDVLAAAAAPQVPYAQEAAMDALCSGMRLNQTLLSHLPMAVTVLSLDGRVSYQNGRSVAYMGYAVSTQASKSPRQFVADILHPEHVLHRIFAYDKPALDSMWESVHSGKTWSGLVCMPTHLHITDTATEATPAVTAATPSAAAPRPPSQFRSQSQPQAPQSQLRLQPPHCNLQAALLTTQQLLSHQVSNGDNAAGAAAAATTGTILIRPAGTTTGTAVPAPSHSVANSLASSRNSDFADLFNSHTEGSAGATASSALHMLRNPSGGRVLSSVLETDAACGGGSSSTANGGGGGSSHPSPPVLSLPTTSSLPSSQQQQTTTAHPLIPRPERRRRVPVHRSNSLAQTEFALDGSCRAMRLAASAASQGLLLGPSPGSSLSFVGSGGFSCGVVGGAIGDSGSHCPVGGLAGRWSVHCDGSIGEVPRTLVPAAMAPKPRAVAAVEKIVVPELSARVMQFVEPSSRSCTLTSSWDMGPPRNAQQRQVGSSSSHALEETLAHAEAWMEASARGEAGVEMATAAAAVQEEELTFRPAASAAAAATTAAKATSCANNQPPPPSHSYIAEAGQCCWMEIQASLVTDPVTSERQLVLFSHDVTSYVQAELEVRQVLDAEHRILEECFPRHVLEAMTADMRRSSILNAAATKPSTSTIDGAGGDSSKGCGTRGLWADGVTVDESHAHHLAGSPTFTNICSRRADGDGAAAGSTRMPTDASSSHGKAISDSTAAGAGGDGNAASASSAAANAHGFIIDGSISALYDSVSSALGSLATVFVPSTVVPITQGSTTVQPKAEQPDEPTESEGFSSTNALALALQQPPCSATLPHPSSGAYASKFSNCPAATPVMCDGWDGGCSTGCRCSQAVLSPRRVLQSAAAEGDTTCTHGSSRTEAAVLKQTQLLQPHEESVPARSAAAAFNASFVGHGTAGFGSIGGAACGVCKVQGISNDIAPTFAGAATSDAATVGTAATDATTASAAAATAALDRPLETPSPPLSRIQQLLDAPGGSSEVASMISPLPTFAPPSPDLHGGAIMPAVPFQTAAAAGRNLHRSGMGDGRQSSNCCLHMTDNKEPSDGGGSTSAVAALSAASGSCLPIHQRSPATLNMRPSSLPPGVGSQHVQYPCSADSSPSCRVGSLSEMQQYMARAHDEVTVLFADIVSFTTMCGQVAPHQVMALLNDLFTLFDALVERHKVYKVETVGDCYMVCGGLVEEDAEGFRCVKQGVDPLHAQKVLAFATDMLAAARTVQLPSSGLPVRLRVGLHSGPVMSGVVGRKMPRFCLFGDTVNVASRMESTGVPGAIHVSARTRDLLGPLKQAFQPRGEVTVKGKGSMFTYLYDPWGCGAPQQQAAGGMDGGAVA
ncbi:hypothetical protein Agub_g8408 [Astrephomene gubernaculifera]|uniref:PAS domain-containing protein n=1 Tax=Astrephomene gubernaculifera TaxID=47775 RepID=A0AAD3DTC8_9CHLO|nr:hypothetical protein Agub_g8408 [Astrephomene gubernaculifera]